MGGFRHPFPILHFLFSLSLCGETPQRAPDVAFTQPLERAITQLTHALARNAEHRADLLERVLTTALEPEVQPEHLCVPWRKRTECLLDFVGEEAVHRLFLRVRHLVGD